MSRRSRLWKATQRRVAFFAQHNEPGDPTLGWIMSFDDMQDIVAMPFVRNARSFAASLK